MVAFCACSTKVTPYEAGKFASCDACTAYAMTHDCAAETEACLGSPCAGYLQCMDGCTGDCEDECNIMVPGGQHSAEKLIACAQLICGTNCIAR
jgi:hypothetical protein